MQLFWQVMSWRIRLTKDQQKDSWISGNTFLKNQWLKAIHFLNSGGIIGIQLMEKLHLVKLQDDTILLKSLYCMEYQMFLILLNLGMTTSFMIHKIHGTVLVMNL